MESNDLYSSFHLRVYNIKDYGVHVLGHIIIIRPTLPRTGTMSCSFISHMYFCTHSVCDRQRSVANSTESSCVARRLWVGEVIQITQQLTPIFHAHRYDPCRAMHVRALHDTCPDWKFITHSSDLNRNGRIVRLRAETAASMTVNDTIGY